MTRKAPTHPKVGSGKHIATMLAAASSVDDLVCLFRWHWTGPDPKRNRENNNGLSTLAKFFDSYLELSRDWESGVVAPAAPKQQPRDAGDGFFAGVCAWAEDDDDDTGQEYIPPQLGGY